MQLISLTSSLSSMKLKVEKNIVTAKGTNILKTIVVPG